MSQTILPPMGVGDTPVDVWNLVDTGNNPINLTGVASTGMNLVLRDFRTGMVKAGTGVFTITNAPAGQVLYAWGTTDTATTATYRLSLQVTFPSGQILSFGLINQIVQPVLVL